MAALLSGDQSALYGRPRRHTIEPPLQVRKRVNILALPRIGPEPADTGHVRDGISVSQEIAAFQPLVHDPVEAIDLVRVAIDGIRHLARRILPEMMGLTRHRPEPAHPPEQPFIDRDTVARALRVELARLVAEILRDRAGLEDRDRFAAGSLGVDDRGHPVVRRNRQEFPLELIAPLAMSTYFTS